MKYKKFIIILAVFTVSFLYVDDAEMLTDFQCRARTASMDCRPVAVNSVDDAGNNLGYTDTASRDKCKEVCERGGDCRFDETSNECRVRELAQVEQNINQICEGLTQNLNCSALNKEQCVTACEGPNDWNLLCKLNTEFICVVDLTRTKNTPTTPTGDPDLGNCKSRKVEKECTNLTCFWLQSEKECFSKFNTAVCTRIREKKMCKNENGATLGSNVCSWNDATSQCQTPLQAEMSKKYGVPDGYDGPLPACAFDGSCRNVNDLVMLGVRVAKWLFGFIGVLAFVMFIAGGITMILSFGNTERFKKGQEMLVGAVIGIAIVFGAFILVDFILDALGVSSSFRAF